MKKRAAAGAALAVLAAALPCAGAEPFVPRSGYDYATPVLRQLQDDAFANPGMLWVERGRALWSAREGAAGKACADCHGAADSAMAGVGARYPVFDARTQRPLTLEGRVERCRREHVAAPAPEPESEMLLALVAFIRNRSHGMQVAADTDGALAPFAARGRALWDLRIGQMDLSCAACHDRHAGATMRDDRISQGQSNGFPAYRLQWQTLGSLHRRFQNCNYAIGAEPLPAGSDDYVDLEVYLAARGKGLPVEAPSVRR